MAVHEEIAREVDRWLRVLFSGQRKTGHVDLEAVEMMVRSGMHRAGAAGLQAMLAEAGCKTVIGSRLKQSGMFWTLRGANSIIALRCCHLNGRFETSWEARAA